MEHLLHYCELPTFVWKVLCNTNRQQRKSILVMLSLFGISGVSLTLTFSSICLRTNLLSTQGPLRDPVTWYRINYGWTQITQWDFKNKGTRTSPARL